MAIQMNQKKMWIDTFKSIFVPGFLTPSIRAFYFVVFLLITVLQAYFALLAEEKLDALQYLNQSPNTSPALHTVEY